MTLDRLRVAGAAALAFVLSLSLAASAAADQPATPAGLLVTPAPMSDAAIAVALQTDLNDYLKAHKESEHVSASSLTVSLKGDTSFINVAAGTTEYGGTTNLPDHSLWQIGSNTKAFTAVAVLQLEAQGLLSIDAPIGTYLPQYPKYAKLTLRRLLNMTSGLESYDNLPAWYKMYVKNPMANVAADTLIKLVYPDVKSEPGTAYSYSNTGYLIAQEVVAARSKSKNFATEIDRIIASAGLKHTYYTSHLYPSAVAKRVVSGYYENDDPGFGTLIGRDVTPWSLSWAQGAGSIVSTPEDLTIWARALYAGTKLLPAKQKAELMTLVSTKTGKDLPKPVEGDAAGFGLGVAERYDKGLGTFWFYQGETLGFRAAHLYFPASGLVIALFANSRPIEKESELQQLFGIIDATIKANTTS